MEYTTKYGLGDVLLLTCYDDFNLVGIVTSMKLNDYNGKTEVYYELRIGDGKQNIPEENYVHNDGGEPYYTIIGKVGSIYKITN